MFKKWWLTRVGSKRALSYFPRGPQFEFAREATPPFESFLRPIWACSAVFLRFVSNFYLFMSSLLSNTFVALFKHCDKSFRHLIVDNGRFFLRNMQILGQQLELFTTVSRWKELISCLLHVNWFKNCLFFPFRSVSELCVFRLSPHQN